MPPLPIELYQIVAQFSELGSLARLVCVSRAFHATVCPILWENLPDAQILLDLLDHPSCASPWTVTPFEAVRSIFREGLSSQLIYNKHQLSVLKQYEQFGRWKAYARYVKRVVLNKGRLTCEKRRFLLQRALETPLLPHLETLLLSTELAYDGDPGHGLLRPNTIDAEHLTILFLSPSLHTLTMSFAYLQYVNLEVLTSRSPRLHNLHIGVPMMNLDHCYFARPKRYQATLGHRPGYPTRDERKLGYLVDGSDLIGDPNDGDIDPLGGMERAIINWHLLSTMTIGGCCLELVDLTILTKLSLLVSLTIVEPPHRLNWGFYAASSTRFISLRSLTLRCTGPKTASFLLLCPFLVSGVHRVCWDDDACTSALWDEGDVSGDIYNLAIRNLAKSVACLQYLRVRCTYSSSPSGWSLSRIFQPLDEVKTLSELHIIAFDEEQESRPISTLPGPLSLERLTIEHAPVSMSSMPLVAWSCPRLEHLNILINLHDNAGLPTTTQTPGPVFQAIQISLQLRMAGSPNRELMEGETKSADDVVLFLRTIWPNLSLTLNQKHHPMEVSSS